MTPERREQVVVNPWAVLAWTLVVGAWGVIIPALVMFWTWLL